MCRFSRGGGRRGKKEGGSRVGNVVQGAESALKVVVWVSLGHCDSMGCDKDTSMVASTSGSVSFLTASEKGFKKVLRMVSNISFKLGVSKNVNDKKLKWRMNRGVIGFLPPPGGPIAQTNCTSKFGQINLPRVPMADIITLLQC